MKKPALVLLHGWGCDSSIWSPLLPQLKKIADVRAIDLPGFGMAPAIDNFSLDTLLESIFLQLPDACTLLGWSLGGMLAVQLAARYPQKISRVITLASNVKFVANEDYPQGMARAVNDEFNKGFAENSLTARKLFSGLLAQGDLHERALLKKLRSAMGAIAETKNWGEALQLLSQLDNRAAFMQLSQPGLHLLGEADVLVPVTAATVLSQLNPEQTVYLLPETAHVIHWSQPEKTFELVYSFLAASSPNSLQKKMDNELKQRIAQSFSRAAHSYDAVANLQRDVGTHLLAKLDPNINTEVVVDIGCGTGYFIPRLQDKFPSAKVIGIDFAEGMLQVAKARNACGQSCLQSWLCADAECLPLATESVDIIFSSLALQWCRDLDQLFSELHRILRPGGCLFFSTLGPETLHELKSAWQQVDAYVHVNHFQTSDELQNALNSSDFFIAELARQVSVLQFATLSDLTHELKALGAHNVNPGQPAGLTSRKKLAAFKQAYEQYRQHHHLPATYEVFYVVAQKKSKG